MKENEDLNLTENNDQTPNKQNSKMPILALSFNAFAVVFFYLGLGAFRISFFNIMFALGLLFMLASISSPFIAIILGICSLCLDKKQLSKSGILCSVLAIAIPIIFVIVMIILFSAGVAVIRWM